METCFGPHLGHLQANILHKISHIFLLNVHIGGMTSHSLLRALTTENFSTQM